jgi:hypothetical protein
LHAGGTASGERVADNFTASIHVLVDGVGLTLYSDSADVDRLVLPDRIALRLGRMAMRIAAVEAMTRFYLLRVLHVEDEEEARVEAIIGELSFRKLRAALVGAVRDHVGDGDERLLTLRKLNGRISRLEERRNALTHSSWNYSALPSGMHREKKHVGSAGVLKHDSESFSELSKLDRLVEDLDAVANEMSKWYLYHYLGVRRTAE